MKTFVDIAKEFLQIVSSDLDKYTSQKGVIKADSSTKVTLFTPSHIQFAKYGRGPGKMPPIDNILAYVKREGIIFEDLTQLGTAFAIAKSIAKNGTINYVPNAPNALQEQINDNVSKMVAQIGEMASIEIRDKTDKLVTKVADGYKSFII